MVSNEKGEANVGEVGKDFGKFVIVMWPARIGDVIEKLSGDPKLFCIIEDEKGKPVNLVTSADLRKALPHLPKGSCTKLKDAQPWLPQALEESEEAELEKAPEWKVLPGGFIVLKDGVPEKVKIRTVKKMKPPLRTMAAEGTSGGGIGEVNPGISTGGNPLTLPGKIRCLICDYVNWVPEFDIDRPPRCGGADDEKYRAKHAGLSDKIATCWKEETQ